MPCYGGRQGFLFGQGIDGIEGLLILAGGEPGVPVVVDFGIPGAVDGLAVGFQPLACLFQNLHFPLFNDAFGRRAYAQEEAASLGRNLCQGVDNPAGRLIRGIGNPSPVPAQGKAAFPRVVQLCLWYASFRSLVVFVLVVVGTVHGYESGLFGCRNDRSRS